MNVLHIGEAVNKASRPKQLELEVIEASDKNLLRRREDALADRVLRGRRSILSTEAV